MEKALRIPNLSSASKGLPTCSRLIYWLSHVRACVLDQRALEANTFGGLASCRSRNMAATLLNSLQKIVLHLFDGGAIKFADRGQEFTLKSGAKSPAYFNLRSLNNNAKLRVRQF